MSATANLTAEGALGLSGTVQTDSRHRAQCAPCQLPRIAGGLLHIFSSYSRWYVGRHFNSVRISRAGLFPAWVSTPGRSVQTDRQAGATGAGTSGLPLVIYVNHASWWDPLICLLVQMEFLRGRQAFAPIDAGALEQYRFFERLGFFGVKQNSPRGAAEFLRTATRILSQPSTVLWLTPQGRFADVRERPVRFKPGLGHLPGRVECAAFVPLAIEYSHWEERKPEVLFRFGPTTIAGRNAGLVSTSSGDWTRHFESQLEATQEALAREAQRRQPADFQPLLEAGSGVGLIYDSWRAFRARVTGRTFRREHGRL